jgi:hypothetical protein
VRFLFPVAFAVQQTYNGSGIVGAFRHSWNAESLATYYQCDKVISPFRITDFEVVQNSQANLAGWGGAL